METGQRCVSLFPAVECVTFGNPIDSMGHFRVAVNLIIIVLFAYEWN